MTIIIPQPDCWLGQVVFGAQCTQACCAQEEESASPRLQTKPAGGEYPQEVATGKKKHVTLDRTHTFDRAICPRANLARCFPARAAIAKDLPIRALPMDVSSTATLVLAIVPLD